MPLVALDRASIAYGHLPLLDEASLQIEPKERVAVLGRNGTGKSTLLRIINGEIPPDSGTAWRQPALKTARLEQDIPLSSNRSVFDIVADGHTHTLEDESWLREHHVDLVLSRLSTAGRRQRRHAVWRMAATRPAGASVSWSTGSAAAR